MFTLEKHNWKAAYIDISHKSILYFSSNLIKLLILHSHLDYYMKESFSFRNHFYWFLFSFFLFLLFFRGGGVVINHFSPYLMQTISELSFTLPPPPFPNQVTQHSEGHNTPLSIEIIRFEHEINKAERPHC